MPLVTADDVQARMARALTGPEQDAAEAMSADFQTELESHLGRPLEPVTVTEERYLPDGYTDLALRQTPVVSITSVHSGSALIDPGGYDLTANGVIFTAGFPRDVLSAPTEAFLTIVYTAGMDPVRAAPAKSVITSRVVRALNRRRDEAEGASALGVEDYKAAYEEEGFTDKELKAVSRLRRRVIV